VAKEVIAAMNGKLVYWVLSLLIAVVGFLGNLVLTDIRSELRNLRTEVRAVDHKIGGMDVLENRVQTLERFHTTPGG